MIEAILATLAMTFLGIGVQDLVSTIGTKQTNNLRHIATDLANQINNNSQMLSDFKSKTADQRANLINSLVASQGYGKRVDAIRNSIKAIDQRDTNLTKRVEQANAEASKAADDVNTSIQSAQNGVSGLISAVNLNKPNVNDYKVADPSQNINGGIQGGK